MNDKYFIRVEVALADSLKKSNKETSCYPDNWSGPIWNLLNFSQQVSTPMRSAKNTYPAAGVMATSPATAPLQNPTIENLPESLVLLDDATYSSMVPIAPPAQAAKCVEIQADTARRFAPSAEPPLNPNHPIQRNAVPRTTLTTLCGLYGLLSRSLSASWSGFIRKMVRFQLQKIEYASELEAELIWTTVPPAKSKTPLTSPFQ